MQRRYTTPLFVVLTIAVVTLLFPEQASAKSTRIRNRQVYEVESETDSSHEEGLFQVLEHRDRELELKGGKSEKSSKDAGRHEKSSKKSSKKEEKDDEKYVRQVPDDMSLSFSMDFCMSLEMEFCMSM